MSDTKLKSEPEMTFIAVSALRVHSPPGREKPFAINSENKFVLHCDSGLTIARMNVPFASPLSCFMAARRGGHDGGVVRAMRENARSRDNDCSSIREAQHLV